MTQRSKPRLSDVAKLAGVSLGTASNVFSYPDKVRPEVRSRVHAAAAELHYLGPDPAARLMRAGKVNAIGIVAPAQFRTADAIRNSSFQMFMCGVAEVCDEGGQMSS
ncbi:MAG: LacI family DNA-binding transcriptional regulator [Silicimonas sp.]|nr:LacI family DNA-binding transcriptional regulator [Silicimonas sp.]NND40942.1 LacI family DNA-binding transcriptional regulator [Silicimonas sp.]